MLSVAILGLGCSAVASGTVRTGSITLNPNPTEPQFGSPPAKPLIPVVVSYDDQEGSITISEGGSEQFPFDPRVPTLQVAANWKDIGFVVLNTCVKTIGPESPAARIGWGVPTLWYSPTGGLDEPFGQRLLDDGIGGELTSHVTISQDRSTWTSVWSDPVLAGQNFTCFTLEERGGEAGPKVVFAGYAIPEPQPETSTPSPTAPAPRVTAHRTTKAQVRALEAIANSHHSDGFNTRNQYLTRGETTSNGWADAEQRYRQPTAPWQRQKGIFIVFHMADRRWRVYSFGSPVSTGLCHPGKEPPIPSAVCHALGL